MMRSDRSKAVMVDLSALRRSTTMTEKIFYAIAKELAGTELRGEEIKSTGSCRRILNAILDVLEA